MKKKYSNIERQNKIEEVSILKKQYSLKESCKIAKISLTSFRNWSKRFAFSKYPIDHFHSSRSLIDKSVKDGERILKGIWWTPENPQKINSGTLVIKKDSIVLNVIKLDRDAGLFFNMDRLHEEFETSIILGTTVQGLDVTLFRCYEGGSNSSSIENDYIPRNTLTSQDYIVLFAFLGGHFKSENDLKFNSLSINYTYLNSWVFYTSISTSFSATDRVSIKYTGLPKLIISSSKNQTIFIETETSISPPGSSNAEINETKYITSEFESERTFVKCFDYIHYLQNFLTLAVGKNVYVNRIFVTSNTFKNDCFDEKTLSDSKKHIYPTTKYKEIEFIYSNPNKKEEISISKHFMNFTFQNIIHRPFIIENWLNNIKIIKPVYDLYFAVLYSPSVYDRHKFLSFVQALEVFHRRLMSKPKFLKAMHRKLVKVASNAVKTSEFEEWVREKYQPDELLVHQQLKEYRDWIKEKLQWNELTLRERLTEMFNKYDFLSTILRRNYKERFENFEDFIGLVVNSRNYFTHFTPKLKKKSATNEELVFLNENLIQIIGSLLLHKIGFEKEEVVYMLKTKLSLVSNN